MWAAEERERKNKKADQEDEHLWGLEEAWARAFRRKRGAILNWDVESGVREVLELVTLGLLAVKPTNNMF